MSAEIHEWNAGHRAGFQAATVRLEELTRQRDELLAMLISLRPYWEAHAATYFLREIEALIDKVEKTRESKAERRDE